jgi:hypothetical protein
MKKYLLCLLFIGCAPVQTIRVNSNVDGFVNVNGERVCNSTKNCSVGISDSAQKNFVVVNKKNYFSKYFSLNGNVFGKDTTVFVSF